MELKKSLDLRRVFVSLYVLFFAIFLAFGLQPAEATRYEVSSTLSIPSVSLASDVTTLHLENHKLKTPATIVGSFSRHPSKTLLIGHASTVFQNLNQIKSGDQIIYDDTTYYVTDQQTFEKNDIDMDSLLAPADHNTIIIMTCAGTDLGNGDSTHRLIVTAVSS